MKSQSIKTITTALFILTLGLSTQAAVKKYLVTLKPEANEKSVALLGGFSKQVERLENIQSLVVTADEKLVSHLKKNPSVLHVEEEVFRPSPAPRGSMIVMSKAQRIKQTIEDAGKIPGLPWGIQAVKAREAWLTSAKGKGARVLVLDTGIDRDHPSLSVNFEKGEDFVGDLQDGYPYADTNGHGTHVAGTIAGAMNLSGFTGVAPEAKILAGRVCAKDGCSNISIARGIDWGVEQNVDVISMSLGGPMSTWGERMAIDRALAAGISMVAASGNDGTSRVSFPAALPGVVAVGAIDINLQKAGFSQYGPELAIVAPGVNVVSSVPVGSGRKVDVQIQIGLNDAFPVEANGVDGSADVKEPLWNEIALAGLGRAEDFAQVQVTGKFVLIERGEIRFIDKANNAVTAGAAGVIIYNNVEGPLNATLGLGDGERLPIPIFTLTKVAGEQIKSALATDVVRARLAVEMTNYSALDGTSMATPHVSGVIALIKAANRGLTPDQIMAIIKKTAQPLGPNLNNEYGAGLINAEAAVEEALAATLPGVF